MAWRGGMVSDWLLGVCSWLIRYAIVTNEFGHMQPLTPAEQVFVAQLLPLAQQAVDQQAVNQRARARDYARDHPEKYCRKILGDLPWTRKQRQFGQAVLDALTGSGKRKYLLAGGHGSGKTHCVRGAALWIWDAWGSQLDATGMCQGVGIIITAPTSGSLQGTVYSEMLAGGRAAEQRGHVLPGWAPRHKEGYKGPSQATVVWREGPWRMESATPQQRAGGDVAHSASGRHHKGIQVLLVEEAMGVPASTILAMDGLAIAGNVLTLASTNPTSKTGPIYAKVRQAPQSWHQIGMGPIDHPNVLNRRTEIPGAASHLAVEEALRSASFIDRGPATAAVVDVAKMGFAYALPPLGMPDKPGPRPDGIPGHPDAEPHIYEPLNAQVAGQYLDGWLEVDAEALLFNVPRITEDMLRPWVQPEGPPDQVGVDAAQTRPPVAVARWGPSARRAVDSEADAVACSLPVTLPWEGADRIEKGAHAAAEMIRRWGPGPVYVLDQAWGGPIAVGLRARGARVQEVGFGSAPIAPPLELIGPVDNRRSEMAAEAAVALNQGLVSVAYSQQLLTQMEATGALVYKAGRADTKLVRPKEEIERELGRSPDELDALWLALASSRDLSTTWGSIDAWAG